MNRLQMIKKVESLTTLPTLPVVALEVNRLLQDEETPIESLLEILERDQSLVLKILRLVNSSFFGFKNRVSSLRHAVTLLGYGTVQNAVVTVSVIDALKLKTNLKGFDISTFWSHAISVAVMCRHLAARIKFATAEEAFTAGLLHDIGKVVLVNVFPEIFVRILETASTIHKAFHEAEKKIECCPHALIGSHLARRWMLPDMLEQAIKYHHEVNCRAQEFQMANLVRVADTLVNIMEAKTEYRLEIEQFLPDIQDRMVAAFKDSGSWLPTVKTEIAKASDFFKQG